MTAEPAFQRGEVVWGLDPFKDTEDEPESERPFLVLSNETHPFRTISSLVSHSRRHAEPKQWRSTRMIGPLADFQSNHMHTRGFS